MKYTQLQREYALLPHTVPLSVLLARALALQVHYEEKSVGDLFSMLEEDTLSRLRAQDLSQLAVVMEHSWNWLFAVTSIDEFPFLKTDEIDGQFLEQRAHEVREFLKITLGVDQEQLLHYQESRVAQLTEVVRAFKKLNRAGEGDCSPEQLSTLALNVWEKMLNCRPVIEAEDKTESILSSGDQVYLALREVHADGSWDELETIIEETEELAADHNPTALERLQKLEDGGITTGDGRIN